jgi:hypothetical protein
MFEARLRGLQRASTNLAGSSRLILERLKPHAELEGLLSQPFTLLDFQNERQTLAEQLAQIAKRQKVNLNPAATAGLPQYTVEDPEPVYLWARLHQANYLLLTAIHSGVGSIQTLLQLPAITHRHGRSGDATLREFPMRIAVVGSMESVGRFLSSVPLRGQELEQVNLPQALTNKPVLFIDRLMLRKSAPDRPEEVQAEIRVTGFVQSAAPDSGDS